MARQAPSPNTFAGFPPYDAAAPADARIAVLGVPYLSPYAGVKTYDCLNAPAAIRQASLTYQKLDHYDFDFGGPLLGDSPVACLDYGDIARATESFDDYTQTIARTVKRLLAQSTLPVVMGGDHGTTIPVLAGYAALEDLCVVQIDAHLDWLDERDGVKAGFSSPMRRAAEMANVSGVVQIGLRGQGSARQVEVDDAKACPKARLITAEQLHRDGITAIIDSIPKARHYFLTIDADGLDPSIAPGVAYPTPGGVTYYQLFNLMRGLARKGHLAGMDFVEVVPENDVANLTSLFAARQILNFVGLAARTRPLS